MFILSGSRLKKFRSIHLRYTCTLLIFSRSTLNNVFFVFGRRKSVSSTGCASRAQVRVTGRRVCRVKLYRIPRFGSNTCRYTFGYDPRRPLSRRKYTGNRSTRFSISRLSINTSPRSVTISFTERFYGSFGSSVGAAGTHAAVRACFPSVYVPWRTYFGKTPRRRRACFPVSGACFGVGVFLFELLENSNRKFA